ncbi:carbohydrate ABC transporter permease, partial [Clavibacter michiganensis]
MTTTLARPESAGATAGSRRPRSGRRRPDASGSSRPP